MLTKYKSQTELREYSGYRVAVSINNKLVQKYFSFRNYTETAGLFAAQKLERQLLKRQQAARRNAVFRKGRAPKTTKIKGLYLGYNITKKKLKSGKIKHYAYPQISYTYMKDKKPNTKNWFVDRESLEIPREQWLEICLFIKNKRVLPSLLYEKTIANKPDTKAYFTNNPYRPKDDYSIKG